MTPRSSWLTKWPDPNEDALNSRDQGILNDLRVRAKAELKTLGPGTSPRSVASTDQSSTQNLILAMA